MVTLRPLEEADVDHVLTWVNDEEIVGNLASFAGQPFTRDDELAFIRRTLASPSDVVFSVFSSLPEDAGRYLGQVGLHQIHARSRVARLAAVVARKSDWGRGVGSASIRALLAHAFGPMPLHQVWLMVFAANSRGRRTYARLGFVEEGVLREEYFHDGRWHDMVRLSLLAREF